MNRDQKAAVVDEIVQQLRASEAVFAIDFRGLSVAQAADLRTKLREQNTKFQVVKNSLSERAADEAGVDALKPLLVGPTALAFVQGDAALVAKTLSDTARSLRLLEFKGGLMNGTALSAEDVTAIARLPAREVLHAQLVGTIAAPITGLVRGLNALIAGLAIALKQIADEGLVGGEGPAAAPEADAGEVSAEAVAPVASEDVAAPVADAGAPAMAEVPPAEDVGTPAEDVGTPAASAEAVADHDGETARTATEQPDQPERDAASDAEPSDA